MTLQAPPGLIAAGGRPDLFLRLGIYGFPKSGKTRLAMTFPAPLLINPVAEGGMDTARHPDGSFLVTAVGVGGGHAAFLRNLPGAASIVPELERWAIYLHNLVSMQQCPWQTVVLGGFSDVAAMVLAEAAADSKNVTKKGEIDMHAAWGDVLAWYQRTVPFFFSLPLHVIIELGVKASMDKFARDEIAKVEPDLSGKGGKLVLPRELHALFYTEKVGTSTYLTHFQPRMSKPQFYAATRLTAIAFTTPVQDCSYDVFAHALGLPPIFKADPGHPRCQQGRWPWPTPWHA